MTGNELAAMIKESPPKGHKAFFDEYSDYVYAIVYNRLRSCATKEDIEECVSDIFVEVFLSFKNGTYFSGELKGYIGTISKRKAIRYYHTVSARNNRTAQIDDEIKSNTDIESDFDKSNEQDIIMREILGLGEPDSSIILLKYYYNRSSIQIGKKLSMSPPAVRKRAERALQKLKKRLEKSGINM